MTDPSDIASVAQGLSKAQRKALSWLPSDGSARELDKRAPREVSFFCIADIRHGDPERGIATHCSLAKMGASGRKKPGHIWPARTWQITPLGLAVRDHLRAGGA